MAPSKSNYNPTTNIYSSPRPPLPSTSSTLSMLPFLFRRVLPSVPHRLALISSQPNYPSYTFLQLHSTISSFAASLSLLGISQRDIVLLLSPSSTLFPVAFLSVLSLGAIATPANPAYTLRELKKQAQDSNAKLVITVDSLYEKVKPLNLPVVLLTSKNSQNYEETANLQVYNTTLPKRDTVHYFDELIQTPALEFQPPALINRDDPAALLYSSGTTGESKGVVLTHGNFIAQAMMVTMDQDLRGEGHNMLLCCLPMFHIVGLAVITYAQLQRGNSLVVMERFEMEAMLKAVERYRVNHLYVVPPVMIALAKLGDVRGVYDVSCLTMIRSGAAPLGKEVMEEVAKLYPHAQIIQAYGMTESCGPVSVENPKGGEPRKYGSNGHLASGVEAKVLSIDSQNPLPPNQEGELCFRGPSIMHGYLNNPEATKLTLDKEGWLRTGDLGYIDEDGELYIVDRIKELIKYKGFQIAPAELEGLLTSHPEILDAAVISFPNAEAGEVPVAYVVRSRDSSLNEVNVKSFIADQVAPFKRLWGVNFVKDIPKAASGKILRRVLIEISKSKL